MSALVAAMVGLALMGALPGLRRALESVRADGEVPHPHPQRRRRYLLLNLPGFDGGALA